MAPPCCLQITDLLALLTIQNVRLCHILIAGSSKYRLHAVLNVLYGDFFVLDLRLIIRRNL